MKLSSKWFRNTTALTALLMYFLLLHAGLMPCCPCGSGNFHVSYLDIDSQGCEQSEDTHMHNMNVPVISLASSSNHNHDCGCNEITVSNFILEDHESSYQSMKPVRYHFSPEPTSDTIPNASGKLSHVQHFLPPLMGSSATQSIRTVVILI